MKPGVNFLWGILTLFSFFFSACDGIENVSVDTELETSSETLTFTKEGGDQNFTIATNAEDFIVTSPVEGLWLTLNVDGNVINVSASVNETGIDRRSYILINAGNAAERVDVVQSSGDIALFLSPESVTFENNAAEKRIDVIGNSDFTVESDCEWCTVSYTRGADFFIVSVTEMESSEDRSCKVKVMSGDTVKELSVLQTRGIHQFMLPFIDGGGTSYADVFNFEVSRGNALYGFPTMFQNYYKFVTSDSNYPLVAYWYSDASVSQVYYQAAVLVTNVSLIEGDAFNKYMTKIRGFEYDADNGYYVHPDMNYKIVIVKSEDGKSAQINSVYVPEIAPHETFNRVPCQDQNLWLCCTLIGIHGKDLSHAQEWEEQHGGVLNQNESNTNERYYSYDVDDEDPTLIKRAYTTSKKYNFENELYQAYETYNDMDLVVSLDRPSGLLITNPNFEKFMEESGYYLLGVEIDENNGRRYKYGNGHVSLSYVYDFSVGTVTFRAERVDAIPETDVLQRSPEIMGYDLQYPLEKIDKEDVMEYCK